MTHRTTILAALTLALVATACGGEDTPTPAAATGSLRVAHLSPGAPAVDFCIAPHGTQTFTGPIMKSLGVTAGLAYTQVTKYLSVNAQQYDVRLVAPNAASCSTPLVAELPDFTSLPAIPANGYVTVGAIGVIGNATTPFTLKAYIDESTAPSGKIKLRFVHDSPGTPAVDVGTGTGSSFSPIFENVSYSNFAAQGATIDANGYATANPIDASPTAPVTITARVHGTTTDALSIPLTAPIAAGTVGSAFAVGLLTSTATPLQVVLCGDNGPPSGAFSTCLVAPSPPANVRVAHLSPNAPAVDFCLAPTGTTAFQGPVLKGLGVTTGLPYATVTTYVPLPPAAYDVRLVAPNAANCSTSLAGLPSFPLPAVASGGKYTVAAIGLVGGTGAAAFTLKAYADDGSVAATKEKLRFVHASPGTPAVDVGLGSGTAFTPVFVNVAFGDVAAAGSGALVGANGYATTDPLTAVTISARVHGTTADALVVPGVTLAAGTISTAFAIGEIGGANPLKVLLCGDQPPAGALLSTCAQAP
jgi:hypothetical protein